MSTLDRQRSTYGGLRGVLANLASRFSTFSDLSGRRFNDLMPKGLYARSLIIVIAPIVILQSVVAYVFMERHWQLVTYRLSAAVTQDIAALIDIHRTYPADRDDATLKRIARERLNLMVDILPPEPLPVAGPRPFFDVLDAALSREIALQVGRPFWIDTVGNSALVEIRIQLEDGKIMKVFARRGMAYASNSHIFLVWMVIASLVLIAIAILFLRNQIRPIQALAAAAEDFGKGREVAGFRPRGASEVRQAALAFIEMRRRIERQIDQRTTMLAGVSHDLRTILTRFKLELALLPEGPETEALRRDVDEMGRMVEGYLAFARGDAGEAPAVADIEIMLKEIGADAERTGAPTTVAYHGQPTVKVRPDAFRRCIANLVVNAARYGDAIAITGHRDHRWLTVTVDDDGPGIPAENREDVFKPFLRLDDARNVDDGGSGLGLAIARDIARSHGGEISLSDSPLGGLRATVRVPV
ncbi:ATP-binding protein [Phreatobacter oligotrophus]|jgi:two-component system, OmpR family, osmolarity sensor histidine kinase EnvZ|uniref:ATP-binding protein n=1 Tax=Phreatobacter oligotrophus TaxID=1122261 RepID=UPI0023545D06|nr:ATP-binding protein [Phreatobacter oligotrophus]MBX9990570.1 two-component sensor histidine kinase [Phreatobacter oligotrophus]